MQTSKLADLHVKLRYMYFCPAFLWWVAYGGITELGPGKFWQLDTVSLSNQIAYAASRAPRIWVSLCFSGQRERIR